MNNVIHNGDIPFCLIFNMNATELKQKSGNFNSKIKNNYELQVTEQIQVPKR